MFSRYLKIEIILDIVIIGIKSEEIKKKKIRVYNNGSRGCSK